MIYHYTRLETLKSVFKGSDKIELWLSDLRHVNDQSETRIFRELIEKNVNAIFYELDSEYRMGFKELIERRKELDEMVKWTRPLSFGFSFTSAEDSTIFWNNDYAKDNGAAIEFNSSNLLKELDWRKYNYSSVIYDDPDNCSQETIKKISELIPNYIKPIFEYEAKDDQVRDIIKAVSWSSFISQNESLFKLRSWEHERENRIVYTINTNKTKREPSRLVKILKQDKYGEYFPKYPDEVEYRISNGIFTPYVKIELPTNVISRIYFGPNCHETTTEVFENYLQSKGYPFITMEQSKARILK